jgi:hypothetical protein
VALLVGLVSVVFLMSQTLGQGAPTATPKPITSGQAGPQTTSAPAVAPRTAVPPPATTAAPTTAIAPTGPEADKELAKFVESYYSDVTDKDKRDSTFARLSSKMQGSVGRRGYEIFWKDFESVDVNNHIVASASARTATASLTYKRLGGQKTSETDAFTFVRSGGTWLIDTFRPNA